MAPKPANLDPTVRELREIKSLLQDLFIKAGQLDPTVRELREIKSLLQDLFIIEAARTGMKKAQARELVGVADERVSRIWKHFHVKGNK